MSKSVQVAVLLPYMSVGLGGDSTKKDFTDQDKTYEPTNLAANDSSSNVGVLGRSNEGDSFGKESTPDGVKKRTYWETNSESSSVFASRLEGVTIL